MRLIKLVFKRHWELKPKHSFNLKICSVLLNRNNKNDITQYTYNVLLNMFVTK